VHAINEHPAAPSARSARTFVVKLHLIYEPDGDGGRGGEPRAESNARTEISFRAPSGALRARRGTIGRQATRRLVARKSAQTVTPDDFKAEAGDELEPPPSPGRRVKALATATV
jgi:hypothetical protein